PGEWRRDLIIHIDHSGRCGFLHDGLSELNHPRSADDVGKLRLERGRQCRQQLRNVIIFGALLQPREGGITSASKRRQEGETDERLGRFALSKSAEQPGRLLAKAVASI